MNIWIDILYFFIALAIVLTAALLDGALIGGREYVLPLWSKVLCVSVFLYGAGRLYIAVKDAKR